jgi:hypothetical protein
MSADDLAEFINDPQGVVRNLGGILDRNNGRSLMDSISQHSDEISSYIGERLSDRSSDNSDDLNESKYDRTSNLGSEIGRRIFGESPIIDQGIDEFQRFLDRGKESQNKEQNTNRPNFARDVQEIMGSRGLSGARDVQQDIRNIIFEQSGGVVPEEMMSIRDGLGNIRDLLGNGMPPAGAGYLDRVNLGLQDMANRFNEISSDDLESIGESLNGSSRLTDIDGDGDVDSTDLAISQSGDRLVNEIRLLHPLIAKANRDPNFLQRKIVRKKINNENINKTENQVNMVQQGIAAYIEDANMFEVKY